ncbi:MAG: hypothetical protein NVS4B5_13300 [Vulcanimicrobiaceae bacterium]
MVLDVGPGVGDAGSGAGDAGPEAESVAGTRAIDGATVEAPPRSAAVTGATPIASDPMAANETRRRTITGMPLPSRGECERYADARPVPRQRQASAAVQTCAYPS